MKNFQFSIFNFQKGKTKGFTLFLSLVIAGTLLLVATSITSLAVKQSSISVAGRDSQIAFYAADTGLECALYWGVRNPSGFTAFDETTSTTIDCNRDASNPGNQWQVGGSSVSSFDITFLPEPYCAEVTVTKQGDGTTLVESSGYNTCDTSNPRRVQRAVRANY